MPSRDFWWGLGAGSVISTVVPHASFWSGYYGAALGINPNVTVATVALAIACVVAVCAIGARQK